MNHEDSDPERLPMNPDIGSAESPQPYETSLYWKIEIHEILSGNRASEIIRAGSSASDYLTTLLPRSSKKPVARHFCVEALNEILDELSLISLPARALNHLLDLLIEFKPRNGFSSLVQFLRLGGTGESNFVPVGAAIAVDLQQKTLETLGTYFEAPPMNKNEPAFLTHIQILNQQLRTNYRGYAASELLKLEVLQPDSTEFKTFLHENPDTLNEIVLNLELYASHGYGLGDLKNLFYVSLESGKEIFNRFLDAIESSGGHLERTEQEDPRYIEQTVETPTHSLRLFDETAIPINLTQEQIDLVYRYRYEDDTHLDVKRLLLDRSLTSAQRTEQATELFAKSCTLGTTGVARFVAEVEKNGANLETDLDQNRVYLKHKAREININLRHVDATRWEIYLRSLKESGVIPSDPTDIEETITETVKEVEQAFRAAP